VNLLLMALQLNELISTRKQEVIFLRLLLFTFFVIFKCFCEMRWVRGRNKCSLFKKKTPTKLVFSS